MNWNHLFKNALIISISKRIANGYTPVANAADVKLDLAVVSQQALLHQVQVDWMVVHDNGAYAALIGHCWIPTSLID